MVEKISIRNVKIVSLPQIESGELSEIVQQSCEFCQKEVAVYAEQQDLFRRLSGHGRFFCTFCLRNGLHSKNSRNVLILSFRSIIGFLYHEWYAVPARKLCLSELEDFIRDHVEAGMRNPCFRYDPDTFLWFIDFNRVGQTNRKIRIEDVIRTVADILTCFNLWETAPGLQIHAFFNKYREAILNFYSKRYRPDGRRMLIPTFTNCGSVTTIKQNVLEKSRDFTRRYLVIK